MNPDFDVVVVGAGPGGSNAAAVCLQRGLRVAQIDRQRFPRVKPCAGGLTAKAWESLQLELDPTLRSEFDSFTFNVWNHGRNVFTHRTRLLAMVLRPDFDNDLVAQNRRHAGFTFHDGERVLEIEHDGARFRIRTDRREITSSQLIGADGAYSTVNRIFGISKPRGRAIAVELIVRRDRTEGDPCAEPCFDFGAIEAGYGWVFPKDDHWSVGLYTLTEGIKDYRARLARYLHGKGFVVRGDPLETFEAHLIPLGGYGLAVPDLPVYLVGDAGGFADALTGEGIYHALESGRLAGETACDVAEAKGSHDAYYRRLKRRVLRDTFLTWRFARPFYRDVRRSLAFLRLGFVWRPLVHGYGRGATFTECMTRCAPYFLISLFGRSSRRRSA